MLSAPAELAAPLVSFYGDAAGGMSGLELGLVQSDFCGARRWLEGTLRNG